MKASVAIGHRYPSQEWLKTVADAIGETPEVVQSLIDQWRVLGKTAKEMEERLTILAQQNGKRLFFSQPDKN